MALALCTADLHTLHMPVATVYVMCARSWTPDLQSGTWATIKRCGSDIDRVLIARVECGTVLMLWAFRVAVKADWLMEPFAHLQGISVEAWPCDVESCAKWLREEVHRAPHGCVVGSIFNM